MKIVHISTSDGGGAGSAAVRLHLGLLKLGVESSMLVLKTDTVRPGLVKYKSLSSKLILMLRKVFRKAGIPLTGMDRNLQQLQEQRRSYEMFSFAETTYKELHTHPLVKSCDIINLHWVANFVDYKSFFTKTRKPIIWTLHDMNPFQGSFHYYEDQQRNAGQFGRLDHNQYVIKKDALATLSGTAITVVTPSQWLADLSKRSEILGRFEHQVIPNGIDTGIFTPSIATASNGRPEPGIKVVVLFVSEFIGNIRKGFEFITTLLLDQNLRAFCEFVAIGHTEPADRIAGIRYMGIISEEEVMSEMYNAADVFLLPSREDNLPNVMIESLCCGTPVVAFNTGGIAEVVRNGVNGYLSDELSSSGLSLALTKCINNLPALRNSRTAIAAAAHQNFGAALQASRYKALYELKSLEH